ncbi:hypothetical protein PR048_029002 [Dryococelus australis]|uniref:NYN domain-containing protein n=1 Tax=Dryococelus australis TaxID=614101 RepID=A0ABQ9GC75_9NEOP|nr:hypothetical protein PR048_029002 [Dryococelus australis]
MSLSTPGEDISPLDVNMNSGLAHGLIKLLNKTQCDPPKAKVVSPMDEILQKYELSPQPPALFDGPQMRKTDKSAFTTLFKNVSPEENVTVISPTFVINGGYILYASATTWPWLGSNGQICDMYMKHITNNYPSAVVVFNGYSGKPRTKIQDQAWRAMRKSCPDIVFSEQTMVTTSQVDFLSNKNIKDHLIAIMKLCLVEAVTIVLDIELSGNPAILVGTDTDLLVMLIYRNRPNGNVKMLHPSTNKTSAKLYDIAASKKILTTCRVQSCLRMLSPELTSSTSLHLILKSYPTLVRGLFELYILVEIVEINLIILMICDYTCTIVQLLDRLSQPLLSSLCFLELKQRSTNTH